MLLCPTERLNLVVVEGGPKSASPNSVEITTKFYVDHNACDSHDDFSVHGNNQPGPQLCLSLLQATFRRCHKSVVVVVGSPVTSFSLGVRPHIHRRFLNRL